MNTWPGRFLLLILLIVNLGKVSAQDYTHYFFLKQHSDYLEYLVNSGNITISHPLSQPFTNYAVLKSLSAINKTETGHWFSFLTQDMKDILSNSKNQKENESLFIGADAGISYSKYFGETDDLKYGDVFLGYQYQNFSIMHRYSSDESFLQDSLYFGSTGKFQENVMSRSSESYLKYDLSNISLFIGRINRNWGLPNQTSLIYSDNAFSFDQLGFVFKNDRLKFNTVLARLDDLYGYDIRKQPKEETWNKRYLSMHRFEISLSKNIEVAFTEAVLYGGQNQQLLMQYINPANVFFASKMNDRKGYEETDANAFMSFDLYYKPIPNLTLYSQFMIDDMDFVKNLRDKYPDRIGISAKMIYCHPSNKTQLSINYSRISNWTYNSFYNWANYTFYGKSIGYPKNGVENIIAGISTFKFAPFKLSMTLRLQKERRQDLVSPFVAVKTKFPFGIGQTEQAIALNLVYFPIRNIEAAATFDYTNFNNFNYMQDNNEDFVDFKLQLKLHGLYGLLR